MGSTVLAGTPRWCHAPPTVPARPALGRGSTAAAGGDSPGVDRTRDGEVALAVGPVDPHPVARQPGERGGRGVPVRVVGAHRDQCHARARCGEELGIGVGAAVVRHLEHVGAQVGPGGHQACLGLRAEVAGEQDPQSPDRDPHDHGQVVGRGSGGRPAWVGRQHLDRRVADPAPVPGQEDRTLAARPRHERFEGTHPLVGRRERRRRDLADVPAGERSGQPTDVVGVQVRHEDQRQHVDPQPVQAPVDGADLRAGVHQDALARTGGQHERVALPDVAGDRDRVGRRPALDRLAQRPAHDDEADERRRREGPQPPEPPQHRSAAEQQDGQQDGARRARRPGGGRVRQVRRALGDEDQPAGGPAGEPHHPVAQRRHDRAGQRAEQTEDGGRRDGGRGQQVGGQRDEADGAGQSGDDRRRAETGGRADRQRVAQDGGTAPLAEPPGPARREQHDRGRGGDREREACIPCQHRIPEQEHAHRRTEGRQGGAGPAGREGDEGDRTHPGRPHDAGAGPGEHHEAEERRPGDERLHAPVDRPAAQRPQHPREHDRHVRPGHGREVREARPAEVPLQHRVHPARVADDQARQQPGRLRLQHPRGRDGEPAAHRGRRPSHRTGLPHEFRWAAGRDHRDQPVPRAGQGETGPDADPLPGHDVPPVLGRGEQEDPRIQPVHERP